MSTARFPPTRRPSYNPYSEENMFVWILRKAAEYREAHGIKPTAPAKRWKKL